MSEMQPKKWAKGRPFVQPKKEGLIFCQRSNQRHGKERQQWPAADKHFSRVGAGHQHCHEVSAAIPCLRGQYSFDHSRIMA